jgi:ubiquinone/menaquinone biosynthesis C-methylase UbiE
LCRGLAQQLPFAARTFSTVVSTFPTEFIYDPRSLSEAARVLTPSGRLVILPAAWSVRQRLVERAAAWFSGAGQPRLPPEGLPATDKLGVCLHQAGFIAESAKVEVGSTLAVIVVATK